MLDKKYCGNQSMAVDRSCINLNDVVTASVRIMYVCMKFGERVVNNSTNTDDRNLIRRSSMLKIRNQ